MRHPAGGGEGVTFEARACFFVGLVMGFAHVRHRHYAIY